MNVQRCGIRRCALAGALLSMVVAHIPALAVTIDWVTVGDPGNAADTTGYGAVNYEYRIGKYEITIQQYTDFLNAVAKGGYQSFFLYDRWMGTDYGPGGVPNPDWKGDLNISGIQKSGTNGNFTYSVIGSGARPITYVSWWNAARFANWMHNGQGSGSTETGAYTLPHGNNTGPAPAKNPGALFYIPTENEWYKAAYYSPLLNSGSGGYWLYATQSDTDPGNNIGGEANQANYRPNSVFSVTQSSTYSSSQNYLTDVGAFTNSASYYGTFDQSGNVVEWNDLAGASGPDRGMRGGHWSNGVSNSFGGLNLSSYRDSLNPDASTKNSVVGFRLASLPEIVITGATETQVYATPVSGIVTTGSGANPQFNGGFSGSLTVTGGTATLGGSVAGTVTVADGAAVTIASGANLTNAKVSLAPGAILAVARGSQVPIAAGNIGGINVSTTSGLAVQVLAGTIDADTTIFATTNPAENFSATGGDRLVGEVLTFQGTGTATWVLQMQYNPASLPLDEATMAGAGNLYLTWRNPDLNAWVNAVDGNTGGTKQIFQRAWLPGDLLGSYGVDITSNTVWAVINHNSDFGVVAVPEPMTLALVASGLACAGWGAFRRRKRSRWSSGR